MPTIHEEHGATHYQICTIGLAQDKVASGACPSLVHRPSLHHLIFLKAQHLLRTTISHGLLSEQLQGATSELRGSLVRSLLAPRLGRENTKPRGHFLGLVSIMHHDNGRPVPSSYMRALKEWEILEASSLHRERHTRHPTVR